MDKQHVLAVVQADLQLICSLRDLIGDSRQAFLSVARNSDEAILYMRGVGVYADRNRYPVPTVVVLDCASPTGEDLEVLAWMREQTEFRDVPVLLLCPDQEHRNHVSCALDGASLLVDRQDFDELRDVLGSLAAPQFYALSVA